MIMAIFRDVVVFGEARKAIFLDQSLGLRLQFRIRSIWIRAIVELPHMLGHGDEALNMLLGEFDLLLAMPSRFFRPWVMIRFTDALELQ
jgi:hypothetical protein